MALVLGAWGAALSTYLAVQRTRKMKRDEQRENRRDERAPTVRLAGDAITDKQGEPLWFTLAVKVVNERPRPIQIDDINFTDDENQNLWMTPSPEGNTDLPVLLQDGEGLTHHFDKQQLEHEQKSRRVRISKAYARDASGIYWRVPLDEEQLSSIRPDE